MTKNLTPPQMLGLGILLWFLGYLPLGMMSNVLQLVGLVLFLCGIVAFVANKLKK